MAASDPDDLTSVLGAAAAGDAAARDRFIDAVYGELHRLASRILSIERHAHTFQTTALVNEAFLNLFGGKELHAADRRHFLNIAARQMRNILIDHARARHAAKREGVKVSLEDAGQFSMERADELVRLDDALKALAEVDSAAASVVELKYFGGYTDAETADILGISLARTRRDWDYARAWLHDYLAP
jgi:RNA polymerase sigma factor (TIGR02999 family)